MLLPQEEPALDLSRTADSYTKKRDSDSPLNLSPTSTKRTQESPSPDTYADYVYRRSSDYPPSSWQPIIPASMQPALPIVVPPALPIYVPAALPAVQYRPYEDARVPTTMISPVSIEVPHQGSPIAASQISGPRTPSLDDDPEYRAFEENTIRAMAEKNGGSLIGHNPRMRRVVHTSQAADDSYRRQRQKNNSAAKQSRDRRKMRELRLGCQVAFLEKKVAELGSKLAARVCGRCQSHL